MLLRRSLATFAVNATNSSRVPNLESQYNFIPATEKDLPKIYDIAVNDFLKTEPHSVALGLSEQSAGKLLENIISKSLVYPYSIVVTEKNSEKVIGYRLMSIGHRDTTLDKAPFDLKLTDPRALILGSILDGLKQKFWQLRPEVKKVLRREVTFVTRKHQRKGIAQHLLHLNLDFADLKASGVEGLVSEASSLANQLLLHRNGYKHLAEAPNKNYFDENGKPYFQMRDGTQTVKLMYKEL